MGSLEARVQRLQGSFTPPPESNPALERLLVAMSRYRAELDTADREADPSGRLEFSEPPALPEPGPLTLGEKHEMLANVPEWIAYLEGERERAPAGLEEIIADAIAMSRKDAERLREEINIMESMEGENA